MSARAHPIRQAVVLAGGLGTRLRPLTDDAAKPMVAVHGRPFLDYLIELLRGQGIERVLVLLGYRAESVTAHYEKRRPEGIALSFRTSPVEDETGRRLKRAVADLDRTFLLLYCDNYWPLNLARAWRQRETLATPAQITVYRNADAHTRSNVRVNGAGYVEAYDRSRTMADLAGVDIGFALIDRCIVEGFPDENLSFEAAVYPRLAETRELSAFVTDHRYYSIGSLDRLEETARFLERRPTVLLDRDGVLNRKMARARYVADWSEWQWLPGSLAALARLNDAGYRTIVATNQPGIARGEVDADALETIHRHMREDAAAAGGDIAAVYHCPHGWDEGCECRKPAPGLLYRAQRDFALDLSRSPFLGDDDRDRRAAEAAGCPFVMISEDLPLLAAVEQLITRPATGAP